MYNELWQIWLGGGKGYFRHSSKLFYIKGIAVGQPPISYHFWVCWWTSFPEKLRPLRLEVAEICWGCWKQPQAHKNFFHNKNLVFLNSYSMFPIKCTVFFSTVTVGKNTVRLIGTIEYHIYMKCVPKTLLAHILQTAILFSWSRWNNWSWVVP